MGIFFQNFENFQNFELKFPKSEANFDAERGIFEQNRAGCEIHLVVIISPGKSFEAVREESSTGGVELLSVVLGQLGPEGVDRDDERPGLGRFQGEFRQVSVCTSCQPQRRESRT